MSSMEILKVNYEIGAKCYTRFQNAFRECIFLGTEGVRNDRGNVVSCYVLNIAGVGRIYLQFDRHGQFENWYHGTACHTPLYPTLEDCKNDTNRIDAMYGSTGNCFNSRFMQQFFPECSVCNCGGTIYAWAWNGTDAVRVTCRLTSEEYKIDENGFKKSGDVIPSSYAEGYCGFRGRNKVYATKKACMADNEAEVVTF